MLPDALDRLLHGILHLLDLDGKKMDFRGKTRLTEVERRLGIYLRALWGREFAMRPILRAGVKPFVANRRMHLPAGVADFATEEGAISSLEVYRAASLHAAAHLLFTKNIIPKKALSGWQMAVIATIEDARVEALALKRYPGLRHLWARQHVATQAANKSAGDYLNRLSRALLDPDYPDSDPWIEEGRRLFLAFDPESENCSREVGLRLANSFKKFPYRARSDMLRAPYRDDNHYVWDFGKVDVEKKKNAPPRKRGRKVIVPFRFAGIFGITREAAAGDDENAKEVAGYSFVRAESGTLSEGGKAAVREHLYPEWDYKKKSDLPAWVTLRERSAKAGDLQIIEGIIAEHKSVISRMKVMLDSLKDEAQRVRKLEDGDEIDINAAIRAQIDIRQGVDPDPRIMMSSVRKSRDISVLVLVDLSKSMNGWVRGHRYTVMELTRESCVLLADAVEKVGDPFAIHGFHSDGRHDVQYFRFKDFEQVYDDQAKARIAAMSGSESTRMGAAIRHATHHFQSQKSKMKLLLVITDGEPSDVDVADREYLHLDTKMAIVKAKDFGIDTYCINLDPKADEYVARIFGARNYMVIDHVRTLPEKLVRLYAGLTR